MSLADREVAEMPDVVIRPDRFVPSRDERLVHRRDRRERPAIEPQRAAMPEMRVAGEEYRHYQASPGAVPASCSTCFIRSRSGIGNSFNNNPHPLKSIDAARIKCD